MGQIILPADLGARFRGMTERQEIRDEQGNLIGYFDPPGSAGGWGPFTAEEVERAFRQTGPGRTLDDIVKAAGLS